MKNIFLPAVRSGIIVYEVRALTILIVEDERPIALALREILTHEGHIIDMVHDGPSGVDYATEAAYDLIILDVMLPGLDGFGVIRALRAKNISTPTLMLTARTATADKVTGLNAGADDYMTKPFDRDELLARVNALTRRRGEIIMDTLSYADLTLDLRSAMLRCGDESVQLSRKEFDVLRIFLTDPQITVTKDALITAVWGMESDATDNNVEAYISFLRKKLRFLRSSVSIKNLQRIGYRLEVSE